MTSLNYQVRSADHRLAIQFVWNGDRFGHEFLVDDQVVGHSVEGDADSDWPPSPPIQQLSLEQINGCSMILGVGAAGRSHWSISAGPCPQDDTAIRLDLACRCKDTPRYLGSQYQLPTHLALQVIEGRLADHGATGTPPIVGVNAIPGDSPTTQWTYRVSLQQPR